ncbi:hypothetical protein K402DRAFT_252530 [Aulographum hederae CBS 113979]|uniref:Uncharacterized protein n=1 Tax=Aulographum hederae CBS 113979 TaxID=1176131 RepID=A0A6G1GJE6_9PEZI|nr:hypothetical protein K402DRAFT_252530 [Aulographum hederae CBS 113979]
MTVTVSSRQQRLHQRFSTHQFLESSTACSLKSPNTLKSRPPSRDRKQHGSKSLPHPLHLFHILTTQQNHSSCNAAVIAEDKKRQEQKKARMRAYYQYLAARAPRESSEDAAVRESRAADVRAAQLRAFEKPKKHATDEAADAVSAARKPREAYVQDFEGIELADLEIIITETQLFLQEMLDEEKKSKTIDAVAKEEKKTHLAAARKQKAELEARKQEAQVQEAQEQQAQSQDTQQQDTLQHETQQRETQKSEPTGTVDSGSSPQTTIYSGSSASLKPLMFLNLDESPFEEGAAYDSKSGTSSSSSLNSLYDISDNGKDEHKDGHKHEEHPHQRLDEPESTPTRGGDERQVTKESSNSR